MIHKNNNQYRRFGQGNDIILDGVHHTGQCIILNLDSVLPLTLTVYFRHLGHCIVIILYTVYYHPPGQCIAIVLRSLRTHPGRSIAIVLVLDNVRTHPGQCIAIVLDSVRTHHGQCIDITRCSIIMNNGAKALGFIYCPYSTEDVLRCTAVIPDTLNRIYNSALYFFAIM